MNGEHIQKSTETLPMDELNVLTGKRPIVTPCDTKLVGFVKLMNELELSDRGLFIKFESYKNVFTATLKTLEKLHETYKHLEIYGFLPSWIEETKEKIKEVDELGRYLKSHATGNQYTYPTLNA